MARGRHAAQNACMSSAWRAFRWVVFLWVVFPVLLGAALTACGYTRLPEERTDDGLVRVPSRASGGVYRDLAADFTPYERFILEPPTIEFVRDWRKEHRDVDDREFARIRDEAVALFRDEFERDLVRRGPFQIADAPAPDVLRVVPRVVDLDIPGPDTGEGSLHRTYTPGPVKMQVTGELRDSTTNALLARIIVFEGQTRYPNDELRVANRVTNALEMRTGFGKWAMMVHEALNVAKAAQPR
jgi:hypothetical protein